MMFFVSLLVGILSVNAENQGVYIETSWNNGFKGYIRLAPSVDLNGWKIYVIFNNPVGTLQVWNAKMIHNSTDKTEFVMTNIDTNGILKAGQSLKIDFLVGGVPDTNHYGTLTVENTGTATVQPTTLKTVPTKSHTTQQMTTGTHSTNGGPTVTTVGFDRSNMRHDYGKAMRLSILFYDAQRSGKLPPNNRILWRNDSAMQDNGDGHDLTGGWYDAADHVKFNLPMAEAAHVLGWGLEVFKDAYEHEGELDHMYDCLKTPLDYFLKCWIPDQKILWVQVGDVGADHSFWGRAEDMQMARPAYKIRPGAPGSDVAGNTVAALAVGSIVFRQKDGKYSTRLLEAAKTLYDFAKANPGLYSDSVPQAKAFYGSSGWKDEMCEAAAEMYKATKENKYLEDAKTYYEPATAWGYSWNFKQPGCQLLLWEITKDDKYKAKIEAFIDSYLPGGSVPITPCGLTWRDQWGPNRYAANAAFIAVIAAADGIGGDKFKNFAMSQINYMLGDNNYNMSYEIGFGKKYPLRPHHRGASCKQDRCVSHSEDNPNTLVGGLVGGPGRNDDYQDRREEFIKNEVACDYNAGFQTACAGLYHFAINNQLPPSPPAKC
ncbi:endoglucanase A-like [Mytilus galloprovincialis]|uniref:endoglucanase A-like n=1 Tax=Mytilus galloprovincialis TaxID=29158 RepID=UPI003F7B7A1A